MQGRRANAGRAGAADELLKDDDKHHCKRAQCAKDRHGRKAMRRIGRPEHDGSIRRQRPPKAVERSEKRESTRTDSIGPIDGGPSRVLHARRARLVGSGAGYCAGHPGRVAG